MAEKRVEKTIIAEKGIVRTVLTPLGVNPELGIPPGINYAVLRLEGIGDEKTVVGTLAQQPGAGESPHSLTTIVAEPIADRVVQMLAEDWVAAGLRPREPYVSVWITNVGAMTLPR
ncbi:hypothetical protein A2160_01780 [Candidatus Beckwithbacteria bacterium RBG_13_42_9]|uniref:Uncharacterized protein n=1 Tax=Candidatus Beckwithbacteria bacterium RBG_13_42_9 TaxID=1797457 RepID=A0A1F5E891_9BACT|nr:MAG: hypothetical protein A2160_01780 [Candidatus Beckwithbacteria bacterium RBG_13_42_9]